MMQKISKKDLLAELDEHNDFFDMVVDLIPAKIYGVSEVDNSSESQPLNSKYHKKGSEPSTQKMNRKAAIKQAKRRKLDPANAESTSELQQEQDMKESSSEKGSKKGKNESPLPDTEHVEEKKDKKMPKVTHTSRIEALRAKLQAKIAEKQASRPEQKPDQVSKRAARRAEKRKRQEDAKKRAQKKNSSATNITLPKYELAGSNATPAEDLAQVDFGRLTGLNAKDLDPTAKSKEILQKLTKPKNLHKMLADAEAKQQKLEELKQGGEKEKEKLHSMQWTESFKEADGTRVKDDPKKLKQALKRKAVKKAKSQKAWQSRTEQVSAAAKERQLIREHNLNTRKEGGKAGANLSRKEIRKPESAEADNGRKLSRAGFEGRKQGFLNNEKKTNREETSAKGGGKKHQ